jgi:hypothetical protein
MIDALVVGITWFVALFGLVGLLAATGGLNLDQFSSGDPVAFAATPEGSRLALFSGGVLYALAGFYHVYSWSRMRATPGQQLLRIEVLDARTGGSLDTRHALARWIARDLVPFGVLLGALILLWYTALAMSVSRGPSRRGFHDLVAGSVVVAVAAVGSHGTGRST